MLVYKFSYQQPNRQFIDIEFVATISQETVIVNLPAWRPGRYELGNFAKNIQSFSAKDEKGNVLPFHKLTKDSWQIQTKGVKELHVFYNYYAAELNAGSSYLDDQQLYVNPVNCCLYIKEQMHKPCQININVPKNYRIATSLKQLDYQTFLAQDFHELADSPFIASPTIQILEFTVQNTPFYICLQGHQKINTTNIAETLKKIASAQLDIMGDFPFDSYHFLCQILPYAYYHGVEHLKSTVLAFGPTYQINTNLWQNFIELASHELFHAWNVKSIRPKELSPYDYEKENYFKTGYVAEGFTCYYGDLAILRANIFDIHNFFNSFNKTLLKHYENYGRFNLSVANSGFDTWLDGYTKGIPNRKTSIYVEGNLIAFMLDMNIRIATNNQKSLDDLVRILYNDFHKKEKPYTHNDIVAISEELIQIPLKYFFENYVLGTEDFTNELQKCLNYIGYELVLKKPVYHEQILGLKVRFEANKTIVDRIAPNSVAEKNGLQINDVILAINNFKVDVNFIAWSNYFEQEPLSLIILDAQNNVKTITLTPQSDQIFFPIYEALCLQNPTNEQRENLNKWAGK